MQKIRLSLVFLIVLVVMSCSNSSVDDDDMNVNPVIKKLLKISITDNYGDYENRFIYDTNNKVIEIERSFKEFNQTVADTENEIFTYEKDVIVSSVVYKNTAPYRTFKFSYLNNLLVERTSFYTDGSEDEKYQFKYNNSDYLDRLDYFVEGDHQQEISYEYDASANIIGQDDSTDKSVVEYDDKPVPYRNFSYVNKIIFTVYGLDVKQNLSNNNVVNENRVYNYKYSSPVNHNFSTSIIYDSDDYPLTKTLVETRADNTQRTIRTLTFEYE